MSDSVLEILKPYIVTDDYCYAIEWLLSAGVPEDDVRLTIRCGLFELLYDGFSNPAMPPRGKREQ